LVYEELRKLAAHRMGNEAPGQTLQPTALVHEAWLRLVGSENPKKGSEITFGICRVRIVRNIPLVIPDPFFSLVIPDPF